jgi:DNA replication and repair protein RecF
MTSATPACAVRRLRLHRFRNYTESTAVFHPGLNIISGPNAQGKTNLLEAVATLALTRSPRASSSADLLQWGTEGCQIEADVERPAGPTTVIARFEQGHDSSAISRRITVDGKPRAARGVLGLCPAVLFWPDDLQLVKGGPEGRRRFLDVLLSQVDARAAVHLMRYRRVVEQRNALLHTLRVHGGSAAALVGFTRELALHGSRVMVARQRLIQHLSPRAADAMLELTSGAESLTLQYRTHESIPAAHEEQTEQHLLDVLDRLRTDELIRGMTLVGPHRDDIAVELSGKPARYTASQGQQRSIVLACKIAEMHVLTQATGMSPVLLLDDVVSELDGQRRRHLMSTLAAVPQRQVLITTTEQLSEAALFDSVHHFAVSAGTVSEVVRATTP